MHQPFNAQLSKPYLQFRDVHIEFGSNRVLEGVSFSVMRGQTVCIVGKSGVGKSVCLRIAMGFLKPSQGRVLVAGEDITDYSEDELERIHKKLTMVFQSGALFDSLTVAENVAFPLETREELPAETIARRVDELLELVGLEDERNLYPEEISVGEKRGVAIARALAAKPEAILYDEPTTMVDPIMARRLTALIAKLKDNMKLTSVIVTHDMRMLEKLGEEVVFLDNGHVVFDGNVAEMEKSPVPIVRDFIRLDRFDIREMLRILAPNNQIRQPA
jgi:phospholipid/cholesterol/gamma-HCH transport system ATP-binding protein